jgi:hypothetical protein
VPFDGILWGRLQVTKTKMILDGPDDSAEDVRIKYANYLKIDHANKFMSLFEFYRSKYCIKWPKDVNEIEI